MQNGQDKPPKASPKKRPIMEYSPVHPKIPSLREGDLESEQKCFSSVILESNVTPNIARSSDPFSTVPPIVNVGDCGCILRDLETIIVLVLLALNFIPKRSQHSLPLSRSRFGDSATVTLTPGDGATDNKVESSA